MRVYEPNIKLKLMLFPALSFQVIKQITEIFKFRGRFEKLMLYLVLLTRNRYKHLTFSKQIPMVFSGYSVYLRNLTKKV